MPVNWGGKSLLPELSRVQWEGPRAQQHQPGDVGSTHRAAPDSGASGALHNSRVSRDLSTSQLEWPWRATLNCSAAP